MVRTSTLFICVTCLALIGCNSNESSSATNQSNASLQSNAANTISLGDTKADFESIVAHCAGEDITPGLAIVGPNGQHPLHGIVWEFADYECILSVSFDDMDKIKHLDFCTVADFKVSKFHRSESTFDISDIKFNTDKSTTYTKAKP